MRAHSLAAGPLRLFAVAMALAASCLAQDQQVGELKNPFYAFNNSMRGKAPVELSDKAELLADLGYDGFEGHSMDELPELVAELHKRGLKVFTVYFRVDIDAEEEPYDSRIETYLATFLKDSGVILTAHLHSQRFKPSDAAGDEFAVPILRRLADLAHEHGAKVAVYNHANFWAEGVDDGIRLSKKVNRRNFGSAFNLCHWLWLEGEADLEGRLDAIQAYLMSVTLCGADGGDDAKGSSWKKLIQPLGRGSFDNLAFLQAVVARGYVGPIGLQCHGISIPAREHLAESMEAWRHFQREFATAAQPAGAK